MAWGLPKLPGMTFPDPTKTQYHLASSLRYYQGHRFQDSHVKGSGGSPTDVDSNAFALTDDSVNYDPSLTYGRVKQPALPAVIPHWVHYDKRCLNFTAFMKQPVYESPTESFRIRVVNLIYFLEDDSLTVMEPKVRNSGLWQGRLVKRGKIPKNDLGEYWHWKDLNIGKDICIYGKVFHTISCDLFTKEYLGSQGIELATEEDLPKDAYSERERWKNIRPPTRSQVHDDPLRRFLEYDGKVLAFNCVWDDRDSEQGEFRDYKMLYFLQDDTIAIKELHDGRGGRDPFPLMLKKTKLPKKWKEKPVNFPSIAMERSDSEVTEYYAPRDLIVGATVFVLARRFLIYDCDGFTRNYYRSMLDIEQPPRIEVHKETKKEHVRSLPPHIGIGDPDDALQSCFSLMPKTPTKDVIKYNLNANKNLRYLCVLEWVHPEDKGREFVLSFSLADNKIRIGEIPRRNSGFPGGKYLKAMLLETPESDPNFPTYYTPERFFIGAVIPVFKHRFKIVGCDLFVYRYMCANPEKFPQEVIDNVRNYHLSEGNLKDEIIDASREEQAKEIRAQLAKIGQSAVAEPNNMEKCLESLNVVEGQAEKPRPATPPPTTDIISYDESLRHVRQSKPTCDNLQPLKGILKSGSAREDHQKVVCFNAPAPPEHDGPKYPKYPPGQQPHMAPEEGFCEHLKSPDYKERAERRARDECAYPIVPSRYETADNAAEYSQQKLLPPGYLGSYGVDCKEIPDYMKLAPDAYEKAKALRKEPPDVSPAIARLADVPREPPPPVSECSKPPPAEGPCIPKQVDVTFACPHVEQRMPCCDPDKREKTAL